MSITQSDEDQVLDIEGDADEDIDQDFGTAQFTEADLIPPQPENEAERIELVIMILILFSSEARAESAILYFFAPIG